MSERLTPGSKAPDFSLPGDGGAHISLSGYAGQKVVLFFYPRDNTSGCTREAKEFTALADAFAQADTAVIGLSGDSVASHDKFKAKHDLAMPLAADTDQSVARDYGVWVEKSMYGRSYMGIERTTILIDRSRRIVRLWRKVKVPGHAEQVLDAARELD